MILLYNYYIDIVFGDDEPQSLPGHLECGESVVQPASEIPAGLLLNNNTLKFMFNLKIVQAY